MKFGWYVLGVLFAVAATACTTNAAVNATSNFDRPVDVDFLCFDIAFDPTTYVPGIDPSPVLPVNATNCQLSDADNGAEGNSTTGNLNNHLHALVTQFDRGEVAVVDLAQISGVSLVDNVASIPGITFIPVGRLPTALVADTWVPTTAAGTTTPPRTPVIWVANSQDHTLSRINALYIRQPLGDGGQVPNAGTVPLAGSPRDLALDTINNQRLLYVTLPDEGAIEVIDVTDSMNPVDEGLVPVGVPATGDGGVPADGGILPDAGLDASLATTPGHPVTMAAEQPSNIVADPNLHTLYVADDQNPYVHVLTPVPMGATGMTLQETSRLNIGVPTTSVVFVPMVRRSPACPNPDADPDHCASTRYLYVISAIDGAVYGWDLLRGVRVHANILPGDVPTDAGVDAGSDAGSDAGCVAGPITSVREFDPTAPDPYRLDLTSPASAITTIVTQDYYVTPDGSNPPYIPCEPPPGTSFNCPIAQGAGPGELHGVFLGVALRNGNLAVVDIDDYDYNCRINDCNAAALSEACFYRQARHYPRAALSFTEAPRVNNAPILSSLSRITPVTPIAVLATVPSGLNIPRVACTGMRSIMDEDCDPVTATSTANELSDFGVRLASRELPSGCAGVSDADVFTLRNESWTVTYEGVLPGLDLGGGSFTTSPGGLLSVSVPGAEFCYRGTIGAGQEIVTIVDDPTDASLSAQQLTQCTTVFGSGTAPVHRDFTVTSATQNVLSLAVPTDSLPEVTADLVQTCYPQAARFQVRASGQWVAVGAQAGYLHAVEPDTTGACVINPVIQSASVQRATECLAHFGATTCSIAQPLVDCPAGRVCMGPLSGDRFSRVTTPAFANDYFCMQIYPGLVPTMTGNGHCQIDQDCCVGSTCVNGVCSAQPGTVCETRSIRDFQYAFAVTNAYTPMLLSTGLLPSAAQFVSPVGRIYVVDNGQNGLVEYRIDPLTRTRLFN